MIHEQMPKFQCGLDMPRLVRHRRKPFQKGGRATAVRQCTDNGVVGILCDNMPKNGSHVFEQIFDEPEVI